MNVHQDRRSDRRFFRAGSGPAPTFGALTPARQRFFKLVQGMGFGTVYDLHIRGREPVFDPPPRVIKRKKNGVGSGDYRRPPHIGADFALKQEWIDFYGEMDALGDGEFLRVEVAHGVPTFQETEERVRD